MFKLLQLINGFKTYAGAAILFLTGATEVVNSFTGEGDLSNGIALISGAVTGAGLKHATDKVGK